MAGIILVVSGVLAVFGGIVGFIVSYRLLGKRKSEIRDELSCLNG